MESVTIKSKNDNDERIVDLGNGMELVSKSAVLVKKGAARMDEYKEMKTNPLFQALEMAHIQKVSGEKKKAEAEREISEALKCIPIIEERIREEYTPDDTCIVDTGSFLDRASKAFDIKGWAGKIIMGISLTVIAVMLIPKLFITSDASAKLTFDTGTTSKQGMQEVSTKDSEPAEMRHILARQQEVATMYLREKAPHLVKCVPQLVDGTHERWVEAIGISAAETSFGTKGVAVKFNNLGGVKSNKCEEYAADGINCLKRRVWRIYENKCDGLVDIALLLENDRYRGRPIDEITEYCGTGHECKPWVGNVMKVVEEIRASF